MPEVPVIVRLKVPVAAEDEAVSVSVEDALPLAGGVTLPDEKLAVTPGGRPEMLRLVELLKLFWLVIVTEGLVLAPRFKLTEVGETPMVKSGPPDTVRLSVVLWLRLPEVPVIVRV